MKIFYLIIFVINAQLFGAITTNNQGYFDCLPPEIICRLIVTQEPEETLKHKLSQLLESNNFKKNIVPGYRLLMTCKTLYFNPIIKEDLDQLILSFPPIIHNYIFLNSMIMNTKHEELNIELFNSFENSTYEEIENSLQNYSNKIINLIWYDNDIFITTLPEALIMYVRRMLNHNTIDVYYTLFHYIVETEDLSRPTISNPNITIAQVIKGFFDYHHKKLNNHSKLKNAINNHKKKFLTKNCLIGFFLELLQNHPGTSLYKKSVIFMYHF